MVKGVSRIFYDPELNRPIPKRKDAKQFLMNIPLDAIFRFLDTTVREVVAKDDSDIRIVACFSEPYIIGRTILELIRGEYPLCKGDFSMILYPHEGQVGQYLLNPESSFFSNAHQNLDTVIINDLKEIVLNEEFGPRTLKFGKGSYNKSDFIRNYVSGGLLLKRPLKDYAGFKNYLEWPKMEIIREPNLEIP